MMTQSSSGSRVPAEGARRPALTLLLVATGLVLSPLAFWAGRQQARLQTKDDSSSAQQWDEQRGEGSEEDRHQADARAQQPSQKVHRALEGLRLALELRRAQLDSPVARLATASATESAAVREARHRDLAQLIDERAPRLSPEKRAVFTAINDRIDGNRRLWRASFMLDQMSEDAYVEALKEDLRNGLAEARRALSPEEANALLGDVPSDPFAPIAPPTPAPPADTVVANAELLQAKARQGEQEGEPTNGLAEEEAGGPGLTARRTTP